MNGLRKVCKSAIFTQVGSYQLFSLDVTRDSSTMRWTKKQEIFDHKIRSVSHTIARLDHFFTTDPRYFATFLDH